MDSTCRHTWVHAGFTSLLIDRTRNGTWGLVFKMEYYFVTQYVFKKKKKAHIHIDLRKRRKMGSKGVSVMDACGHLTAFTVTP